MSFDFNLAELAGWAGAILILTACGLLSVGKLSGRSLAYQTLNIVVAIGELSAARMHSMHRYLRKHRVRVPQRDGAVLPGVRAISGLPLSGARQ